MYNWFSVDLASELRPSDCDDLNFVNAIPPKSTKLYLPKYKYLRFSVQQALPLRAGASGMMLFFFFSF